MLIDSYKQFEKYHFLLKEENWVKEERKKQNESWEEAFYETFYLKLIYQENLIVI